jgi:hypothetical protein
VGAEPAGVFNRRDDLYAVRGTTDRSPAGVARIQADAENHYTVHAGPPAGKHSGDDVIPVYSAGADGPLAVPTGRLFVRFAEGIKASDRAPALRALGFAIERSPSYAPSAAWVTPLAGSATAALDHIEALQKLPDVAHVEPQLVMERAEK